MKLFDVLFSIEDYSRATHAEAAKADELDGLLFERERRHAERRESLTGAVQPSALMLHELIERTLETRIDRVRGELASLRAEAERKRLALVEASAKARAVEALDERRRAESAKIAGRNEQAVFDEAALRRPMLS
jgi:flagellar export protein FliJ